MFSKYTLQNPSSWTIFIFGLLAFLLGGMGLLNPDLTLRQLGFAVVDKTLRQPHDYTLVFIMASSMASFNIGIYYMLAALNNMKAFYRWTVPFRTLTFILFTSSVLTGYAPTRFLAVPIWEFIGAISTGVALYYEQKRGIS